MMKIKHSSFNRFFELSIRVLFVILVIGVPLAFTSYTRSVFEVNKLMVLRYVTLGVCGLWFFRSWLHRLFLPKDDAQETHRFLGFTWVKTGLDKWFLAWVIFNILSTIFSQNVRISVIGAYDRWEGIMTALNYVILVLMTAKLVASRQTMLWILGAALAATGVSAIYGVFQSLEMDFMRWSVDPAQRVFACINNPVHFCAYVAMMVPVGVGLLMFLSSQKTNKPWVPYIKCLLLVITGLIFYTQFLSFSRATWIGFIGAMPLFYFFVTHVMDNRSVKTFSRDFFLTAIALAAFYTSYVFQFHQKGLITAVPIFTVVFGYLIYLWDVMHRSESESGAFSVKKTGLFLGLLGFLFVTFLWRPVFFEWEWLTVFVYVGLWSFLIFLSLRLRGASSLFLGRLVLILCFALLQFIGQSFLVAFSYFVLSAAAYLLVFRNNTNLNKEKRMWLTSFLVIFGSVVFLSAFPIMMANLLKVDTAGLTAVENAQQKMTTYSSDAMKGSARTSMWKSAIPWTKDYWLLGSGLDTIKYMYPDYRRSEYGILEGGHNFTPDRLHNEYLNNFATRGIPATLLYYFGIVLGWYIIVVKGYYRFSKNPYRYLLAGCVAGVTIYLGQVMFNFGVVATLVLFYLLMGLGWAFVLHPAFWERVDEQV